ncbi:MAG: ABC transporter ATP-binding protein [Clostridia bacterium]|nr:ABC transporter ATP-binding protein [Clostridia bacterium]
MPIITTDNLCRVFKSGSDTVHAVDCVNLSVEEGGLTILRGRSGSGKTTLINLLGALDRPTSGTIHFCGSEISSLPEKTLVGLRRKEMGFVFQSFALLSLLSAFENVEFPLRLNGLPPKQREKRVAECLGMVGLAKRMSHRPSELSGGEQQRVAVARAVVHHPKVIFADEPTAQLDTHMALQVMRVLREVATREKVTVVMTTHDPNLMELADQVYTLEDGRIVE